MLFDYNQYAGGRRNDAGWFYILPVHQCVNIMAEICLWKCVGGGGHFVGHFVVLNIVVS